MPSVQHTCARSARAYACANSRITSAFTVVNFSARSSVYGSTDARYASKPVVARSMNAVLHNPAAMISRPIAFARAMSDPTSSPSQTSANAAELVRRGSIAYIRAPRFCPFIK